MGIPDSDETPNAKISAIANVVEDFCDSYTNRKLEAQRYLTDPAFSYIDGRGKNYIYLPQYPVSYVSSINMDGDRVFNSGTLFASADYFWYPKSGKVKLSGSQWPFDNWSGGFYHGYRNILVDYVAGYAPVVGGTHNASVSTYPLPQDLKQVMTEMCVESFKEGLTAVHTIQSQVGDPKFTSMLTRNSFWLNVLNKYKNFSSQFTSRDE
jgi:hypothetical protein